jgi:2-hydroxy-3-oxopropionate reductase
MRVGFIGLGRMGESMATRIAGAGHVVFAYDVLPAKQKLAIPGVSHCPSAAVAAEDADVIVTSPPGPSEVSDVVLGSGGLRSALPRPAVLIETSTIAPDLSRTIASELTLREISYLDAPVSGGARVSGGKKIDFSIKADLAQDGT